MLGGGGGASTTINNNVDNYIITATGTANTLNGESNLQFNGTTLTVVGNVTASSFTGSLQGSASFASRSTTASFATTASYVNGTIFTGTNRAASASFAKEAETALTASIAVNSTTASYVNGNILDPTNPAKLATTALTASIAQVSQTSSYSTTLGATLNINGIALRLFNSDGNSISSIAILSASSATSASFAQTASFVNATNITTGTLNNSILPTAINVVSVTGSLRGSLIGTSSWATNALTASTITGGTANYIPLWTNANTVGSSVIYQSGTSIGLGTTAPNTTLHISASSAQPLLNIENAIANGYSNMRFTGTGRKYVIGVGNASETTFGIANEFFLYDDTTGAVRMVVDPNGRVGINTTTPAATLDVNGTLSVTGSTAIKGDVSITGGALTATLSAASTISTGSLYTFVGELATDLLNNSATVPSDVPGFSFPYSANAAYDIVVHGLVSSSVNSNGCGFTLSASSAITDVWSQQFHQSSTQGALAGGSAIGSNNIVAVSQTTGVAATGVPVVLFGYLRTANNAGTCTLKFRAEVGSNTTLRSGSVMFVRRLL